MSELISTDLNFVVQRLPSDIRDLMKVRPQIYVGGGFIRAVVGGEEVSDIDIFGPSKDDLDAAATQLAARRPGSKIHRTGNAITLLSPERMPVQFITRWTFNDAHSLTRSFDFTVCQAAVWRNLHYPTAPWESSISNRFYIDLAARRLVYTAPIREEEAGGSLLRVLKYTRRGYTIQMESLGEVVARIAAKAGDPTYIEERRKQGLPITLGRVMAGLLREVDPLMIVDGLEMTNDHEPESEG